MDLVVVNHRYLGESGRLGFGGAYIVLISGGIGYKYSWSGKFDVAFLDIVLDIVSLNRVALYKTNEIRATEW